MRPDTGIQISTVTGMPVNEGIHKDVNAFRFVLRRIQLFFTFFFSFFLVTNQTHSLSKFILS